MTMAFVYDAEVLFGQILASSIHFPVDAPKGHELLKNGTYPKRISLPL